MRLDIGAVECFAVQRDVLDLTIEGKQWTAGPVIRRSQGLKREAGADEERQRLALIDRGVVRTWSGLGRRIARRVYPEIDRAAAAGHGDVCRGAKLDRLVGAELRKYSAVADANSPIVVVIDEHSETCEV